MIMWLYLLCGCFWLYDYVAVFGCKIMAVFIMWLFWLYDYVAVLAAGLWLFSMWLYLLCGCFWLYDYVAVLWLAY